MRYKRTMDKPAGLLTILRRAIMDEDAISAATIARKCSQHKGIYFSMYCDFMLRILLEDKYPQGKKYFSALKKERENFKKGVLSNRNKDVRFKDHKYADIAHAIAKLKTNHVPFEQAFYLLYNYVYDHKYCDPAVVDSDGQYNILGHSSLKQRTFAGTILINKEPAVWETVNNDYAGDKLTRKKKTTEINDLQKDCWSNDHVLRELYFSRSNNVTVAAADFPARTYPVPVDEAFASLDGRIKTEYEDAFQKRSRDDEGDEKMFEYLYPKANKVGRFKYSMRLYLKNEGHTHYVGTTQNKRVSVLQHLRYLARCKKSRPREVTLDEKKYGLNYLQFDSSCWTVQLVAHPDVDASEAVSDYPYLLKTFKVLYPETRVDGTTFNDSSEKKIGNHAKVEQLFTIISPRKRNIFKMEANQPKKKLFQFKHLNGDDGDDKCLAFLQVLIYRYKHNYRTTLKDIRYEEKGGSFKMYSLSNNGKKKPNRRHPDIWHQLFYGIQRRAAQTENLSYVVRIIDRLQKFIHDKGHRDQRGQPYAFFKWLEKFDSSYVREFGNAAETIPGLWYRLMDSLDKKERTLMNKYGVTINAPRTTKKLTIYEELQFIEDEFARENV